ncbi:Mis12-domain-containing protein [Aulographum hederae CBS 113979]|uniref:Mis12-domain-containing protein n=1 Tax=Aulographum hederae CBS 113979 TaxID=1176131 RepID=A0A6G1GZT7_9PEZI|nr:Mis12-domain-containing protein [Aulographum hederae CBS 113979]
MASVKQIETSLLTEHLRYTPLTLIDDIINTINELVNRAVDAVEAGLLAADPSALGFAARAEAENVTLEKDDDGKPQYPEARGEIEEGVHKLETLLESNVDRNFDKLEIWVLRNVLTLSGDLVPWVRLGHYENLTIPSSDKPVDPSITPETIHALRRKLQETRKLQTALLTEQARNEALLSQLRSVLSPSGTVEPKTEHTSSSPDRNASAAPPPGAFSFLTSIPAAQTLGLKPILSTTTTTSANTNPSQSSQGPLAQNTAFALSQLPALRTLLATLRPALTSLPSKRLCDGDDAGGGAERERREYIETQTMRILERRGIDVKAGVGAVEGMGRRVGIEEVGALEGVVGAFGRRGDGAEEQGGDKMDVEE